VATIVLGAGSGTRFGSQKQFLELTPGRRLIDAAVEVAKRCSSYVVVVLPPGQAWDGIEVDGVANGGPSRLDSVEAGLSLVPRDADVVVVHDAAHPLADEKTFDRAISAVEAGADAAVPILPVSDVVKRCDDTRAVTTVGRDDLGLAQVPMAFSQNALRAAHVRRVELGDAWEDSMLVEKSSGRVVAVRGSVWNVHVVDEEDLELARLLARSLLSTSGGEGGSVPG
jgi:2-C-methyl-D-erythritol 4-phosphate cytidylyltransferase